MFGQTEQCNCQAWNTLVEAITGKPVFRYIAISESTSVRNLGAGEEPRVSTGIADDDKLFS
ncbi:MAG TPA: hypothetical protein VF780_06135 [Nitrosospira sp.]